MKAMKDVVFKAKIRSFSDCVYDWVIWHTSEIGLFDRIISPNFKTKRKALNNLKKFMSINGFKYEVVE